MKKWTEDIQTWMLERCPVREHGYKNLREFIDDLNSFFGTSFSLEALKTYCHAHRICLNPGRNTLRGMAHHNHHEVGSILEKKGYVKIKVSEPDVWMQYQRYVWERHHPGQSAEGKVILFLDGNNRNFDPDNLECLTRAELITMNKFGVRKDMGKEERMVILLRARIAIQKGKVVGADKAHLMKIRQWQHDHENDEEYREKRREASKRWYERIRKDPLKWKEHLEKQKERYRHRKP